MLIYRMLKSLKLAFEYLSSIGTVVFRLCSRLFNQAEDASNSVIGAAQQIADASGR